MVLLASLPFFNSCTKDTTTTPPTIQFKAGSGYVSSNVTVPVNSDIKIGISAQSGSSKLVNLKVIGTSNGTPATLLDSTFSNDTFDRDFTVTAPSGVGKVILSFTITDADGGSAEVSLEISTVGGTIKSYSQKILGSYDNSSYGSSFASSDGTVYSMADAKTNAAKIDWMYYYGVTNQATLAAPNDPTVLDIFTSGNGPATWSVLNATKFAKVTFPTGTTWDGITDDVIIVNLASAVSESKANMLSVGQIVAFETVGGKMGLIKIETITGTGAGSITYSVKMQD